MDFNHFKSGTYRQQYQYKSFSPTLTNQEWTWNDATINVLLSEANRKIGQLEMATWLIPDVDLFIQMHITKEANMSSRIEGTQTSINEAVMNKEDIAPENRDDWQEVQNYIQAINYAIRDLESLPLSNRLLKKTHEILLSGVRGEMKNPGEYRKSQNWIGGSNLTDAAYIPPSHEEVPELMSDLEMFWHNETIQVPHLIKIAISHYQFETIHPFLDGNGRIGRLLITLYLVSNQILSKPSLYLSAFFEQNRSSYYDALSRVRESNDLAHWVKFFLNAVIEISQNGTDILQKILSLKEDIDNRILRLNRKASNGRELMNLLYSKPVVTVDEVSRYLEISVATANSLIQDMVNMGIIEEQTGKSRNRLFGFKEYIALF